MRLWVTLITCLGISSLFGQVTIDFTKSAADGGTPTWGTNATMPVPDNNGGTVMVMYAGNGNGDNQIIYSGANSDVQTIADDVTNNPANPNNFSFVVRSGYLQGDYNLDGQVIYSGANSDVTTLADAITLYPPNTNNFSFIVITQQIPE